MGQEPPRRHPIRRVPRIRAKGDARWRSSTCWAPAPWPCRGEEACPRRWPDRRISRAKSSPGKLRVQHRHELIPARKALCALLCVVAAHRRAKIPSRNLPQHLREQRASSYHVSVSDWGCGIGTKTHHNPGRRRLSILTHRGLFWTRVTPDGWWSRPRRGSSSSGRFIRIHRR